MQKVIGFWRAWALVVGTMIGNGIFLLPSVLAPYGSLSLLGWIVTAMGTLLIALTLGSLSTKVIKDGGPYAYCHEALGPLIGFLMGWGLWISYWVSIAAASVAFAGYASSIFPTIEENNSVRTLVSISMVWVLGTFFLFGGIRGMSIIQVTTTLAKLLPLIIIPVAGLLYGQQNLSFTIGLNTEENIFTSVSKMVLITMWAFIGIEMATIAARETIDPKRTIPRALFFGLLAVSFVYIFATLGVFFALPTEVLVQSSSPFADVAEMFFGPIGATLVAIGVIISIVGSVNGCFLGSALFPKSMADNNLFPKMFSAVNRNGAPWKSILVSLVLVTIVLLLNANSRLIGMFEFLIILSTLTAILPYAACAIADMLMQYNSAGNVRPLTFIRALGALAFSVFMIVGAGFESILYGFAFLLAGVPIYLLYNQRLTKV